MKTSRFTIIGILLSLSIFSTSFSREKKQFPHYYDKVLTNDLKQNNFCFFFIPKNGSTTLRMLLETVQNTPFDHVKNNLDEYIKFISVRHPLYRPVSIYAEVMKLRKMTQEKTKKTNFYQYREDLKKSFRTFLDEIEDNFYDPHISHQYLALQRKNLTLDDMDYIFLFENLDWDLKHFCAHQNIPYLKNDKNITPSSQKETLIDLINSEPRLRKQIRKLWAKDFEFYESAKLRREEILNTTYKAL